MNQTTNNQPLKLEKNHEWHVTPYQVIFSSLQSSNKHADAVKLEFIVKNQESSTRIKSKYVSHNTDAVNYE